MKLISTGMTDLEIQKIMNRVDADNDGNVSYKEFVAKFRNDPVYEHRMLERAEKKMYEINELMIHHMTSPDDAYAMVSYFLILIPFLVRFFKIRQNDSARLRQACQSSNEARQEAIT